MVNYYASVVRKGCKNTRLMLSGGETILVPNEELGIEWALEEGRVPVDGRDFKLRELEVGDMTFGIEFEFVGSRAGISEFNQAMGELVGPKRYKHSGKYGKSSTTKWVLGRDGSIQREMKFGVTDPYGFELTSPILHFTEECFEEVRKVLSLLSFHLKGFVNKTCGTHVHFGRFTRNSTTQSTINMVALAYGGLEDRVFDRLVSPSRRANRNNYSKSLVSEDITAPIRKFVKLSTRNFSQYHTVENRQHQGTLDAKKILCWAKMVGAFLVRTCIELNVSNDSVYNEVQGVSDFMDLLGVDLDVKEYFLERELAHSA